MPSIFRNFSFKLYPTQEQTDLLWKSASVCRLIYNLALEQRRVWGASHRISLNGQSKELKQMRAEFEWVRSVCFSAKQEALRDLDQAFARFFRGQGGYPQFRKRGENDTFRVPGADTEVAKLNAKWSALWLPKIGWVKFRDTRALNGCLRTATVLHDSLGWRVVLSIKIEHTAPHPRSGTVGIDRGVKTTLALSTGEMLTVPASLELIEARKRRAQRIVSRRERGSKRRARAQRRAARIQARQARIRRDFHHRAALSISRRFGVAVLEDLKTRNMTASARGTIAKPGRNVRQKSGLNRAILNAGWHQFATLLTYKMEERGGHVITVPAHHTSQTCAACGVVDARSRKSQATFACVSCGHTAHADINAAINIQRRGNTSLLDVEGSRWRPVEAST